MAVLNMKFICNTYPSVCVDTDLPYTEIVALDKNGYFALSWQR